MTRTEILTHPDISADASRVARLQSAIEDLRKHKPIQYILGYTEFCNCNIEVNEHVLIPRQETEELVSWVCRDVVGGGAVRILDVGAGSGCIAVALAQALPQARVMGWDVSPEAVAVARRNAQRNGVDVDFETHDILNTTAGCQSTWDVIVSNPPYVCESERNSLSINVLREPTLALFVPDDQPLLFYDRIADFALQHLNAGGAVYFEINEKYGGDTVELLRGKGFGKVELRKDLNGKGRMVRGEQRFITQRYR
jgi:release factor glutamine methyltransferase